MIAARISKPNTRTDNALNCIADALADLRARLDRDDTPQLRAAIGHLLAAGDIITRIDRDGRGGVA